MRKKGKEQHKGRQKPTSSSVGTYLISCSSTLRVRENSSSLIIALLISNGVKFKFLSKITNKGGKKYREPKKFQKMKDISSYCNSVLFLVQSRKFAQIGPLLEPQVPHPQLTKASGEEEVEDDDEEIEKKEREDSCLLVLLRTRPRAPLSLVPSAARRFCRLDPSRWCQ
jgi:hypothetical protein